MKRIPRLETAQNEEKESEELEQESERVTYHEIMWIGGHKSSQDLLRSDPVSLSRRHKRSVHVHKVLVSLHDISHTPPRTKVLVPTHHRHLRSDPTEVR